MKKIILKFLQTLVNSKIYILFLSNFKHFDQLSKYNKDAPKSFKQKLFRKYNFNPGVWIETGTYLGDSTKFLSKISDNVYTIEPSKKYFDAAKELLLEHKNIVILNGTSEDCLEDIISRIYTENISFWLDGHYSGGDTFEGENHSPVLFELEIIKKYLNNFKKINILIDDFRIFNNHYPKSHKVIYPNQSELINWAKINKVKWTVKKNVFILSYKS